MVGPPEGSVSGGRRATVAMVWHMKVHQWGRRLEVEAFMSQNEWVLTGIAVR